ncbi:hypothetical protein OPV22_035228 [Ensete ventricosum]|uniref:Uncharacterized protein n=1 Tax=Ensete ventricosum TaxID=4639 RepID=A0AAX5ND23_ENSVE|nr:hypothetical protein OPV22_035228 [Ensete ventricosum]
MKTKAFAAGKQSDIACLENCISTLKPKVPWARCKKSWEVGLASIERELIPVAAGSVGVEYFLFRYRMVAGKGRDKLPIWFSIVKTVRISALTVKEGKAIRNEKWNSSVVVLLVVTPSMPIHAYVRGLRIRNPYFFASKPVLLLLSRKSTYSLITADPDLGFTD